eukprot:183452-Chlamydomonas_euryale.AAC.1
MRMYGRLVWAEVRRARHFSRDISLANKEDTASRNLFFAPPRTLWCGIQHARRACVPSAQVAQPRVVASAPRR